VRHNEPGCSNKSTAAAVCRRVNRGSAFDCLSTYESDLRLPGCFVPEDIGEAIPVEMVQLHSELHTAFFWLIFVRKFNEPEPGGAK